MLKARNRLPVILVLFGLPVWFAGSLRDAAASEPPSGKADSVDLAKYLELAQFYVAPPPPRCDAVTGFLVAGKNETHLIESLTELNGRKIADLEADMRPGASSTAGFLGAGEKLLDVLAADNRFVVEKLGLSHQELARHLHAMAAIGQWQFKHKEAKAPFQYRGRRYKVAVTFTRGSQPSPFNDGTESGADATVENLDNGRTLTFSLLVPYMIERYGFYEGHGTRYRVDPKRVVEVLDFLPGRESTR